MNDRIHIVVEAEEKERYRRQAEREGVSLSAWLRDAARERLESAEARSRLETMEELRAFFRRCDERETGREPDWDAHRRTIEESRSSGLADA